MNRYIFRRHFSRGYSDTSSVVFPPTQRALKILYCSDRSSNTTKRMATCCLKLIEIANTLTLSPKLLESRLPSVISVSQLQKALTLGLKAKLLYQVDITNPSYSSCIVVRKQFIDSTCCFFLGIQMLFL